jgi:hypothetical protein
MRYLTALLLLAPALALAQTGDVTGRVLDPTGAIIAHARVDVINVESGTKDDTETNGDGYFTVSRLDPGRYRLEIHASGFKSLVRTGITLAWSQLTAWRRATEKIAHASFPRESAS